MLKPDLPARTKRLLGVRRTLALWRTVRATVASLYEVIGNAYLMSGYNLNPGQRSIVERVRKIADEEIAPHASDVDAKGRFPREGVEALGRSGFLGLNVPEANGGMGQGLRVAAAVLDELSRRDASLAMVYKMHLCGVACYVAFPRTGERYLADVVRGRHLSTLAWSEHGSRSHFWAPISQATETADQVVLNAQKSWVTSAGEADGYVVSTKTAGGGGPVDTMLYLVLRGDSGVRIAGTWNGLGMRGNASFPMILENCKITSDRALCNKSEGFQTMLGVVLPWFNIGNEAISVGISEAAVASTTSHLTSKRFSDMNDASLSDLPTLRARLAQMRILTDTARAHLGSVLDSVEQPGPETSLMVLESKAVGAETALAVTDLAMKACGGAAFSKHLSVERNFRDARAGFVMAPTTDVLQELIGRALCGMPLF
jgi:alkylation response protein AidB-like acyl-CoA dehydrogenase